MSPSPEGGARAPVRIVIVNTDPTWDFVALARQRAVDLYDTRHQVNFWQVVGAGDSESDRRIWGHWPRRFHANFEAVFAELEDEVLRLSEDEAQQLAVLYVARRPGDLDPTQAQLLNRLRVACADSPLRRLRIWRLGVFRTLPDGAAQEARECRRFDWFDTMAFIACGTQEEQRRTAAEAANFDSLRVLIDVVRDPLGGWDGLRGQRAGAALWLHSRPDPVANPKPTTALRLRLMIREAVRTFSEAVEAPVAAGGAPEVPGATKTLEQLYTALGNRIQQQAQELPQAREGLTVAWSSAYRRSYPPPFYSDVYIANLEQGADAVRQTLKRLYGEYVKHLRNEQERFDRDVSKIERDIVAAIRDLSDSHIGTHGEAQLHLKRLLEEIALRRQHLIAEVQHLRQEIARECGEATFDALRLSRSGQDAGEHRPAGHSHRFDHVLAGMRWAATQMPHRLVLPLLAVALVVILALPVYAFHPRPLQPASLWAMILPVGEDLANSGLDVVYYAAHNWYVGALAAAGALGTGTAIWRAMRFLGRRIVGLKVATDKLIRGVEVLFDRCLAYSNKAHAVSWLGLVERRLEELIQEIALAEEFERQYGLYFAVQDVERAQSLGVADEALRRKFIDHFHDTMRRQSMRTWLRAFLTGWTVQHASVPLRVVLEDPNWVLQTQSSYFLTATTVTAQPLPGLDEVAVSNHSGSAAGHHGV